MCHRSGQGAWAGHRSAEDTTTEACTDDSFVPHSRQYCRGSRTVHEPLKASVILLSGLVLGTVLVSSRSCVWDLKCSIRKTIPQIRMHMRRMTLMYGSHILVDSALVHDAGIANGAMLSLILTPTHKILASSTGCCGGIQMTSLMSSSLPTRTWPSLAHGAALQNCGRWARRNAFSH